MMAQHDDKKRNKTNTTTNTATLPPITNERRNEKRESTTSGTVFLYYYFGSIQFVLLFDKIISQKDVRIGKAIEVCQNSPLKWKQTKITMGQRVPQFFRCVRP